MKRLTLIPIIAVAAIGTAAGTAVAATGAAGEAHAPTSQFAAYPGPAFTGTPQLISGCGVHNIHNNGSYRWYGHGQDGDMYNQPNAGGPRHFRLRSNRDAQQDTGFGWRSILIVC